MTSTSSAQTHSPYPQLALLIHGQWVPASARSTKEVLNPATQQSLGALPIATESDIDEALASSELAFSTWKDTSAWHRADVLRKTAEIVSQRRGELASWLSLDNGKPLADSSAELDRVLETLVWSAEEATRIYGRVYPQRRPGLLQTTSKRPVGPVAAFAPWNFPALLAFRKVAAALAAGCTVILKPAEESPAVCVGIARAFQDAGLPPGVLNVLFGEPAKISERLIASPVICKVSFTGSVAVGQHLYQLASKRLVPVTMELGGHSPVVVCDDVDVEKVAKDCAAFKYRNAGQVCLSPSRFFVHQSVYSSFVEHFASYAQSLRVGSGIDPMTQMGPLNNERRLLAAERFVQDATSKGARVACGGKRGGSVGYFFAPTVLTDLDESSEILSEEPFCPVAPIVPFERLDEVIERANATKFGLAAYAFTRSSAKASQLLESLEAGWLGVNAFTPALADAPLCGLKDSGLGHEGGREGLESYMHTRFSTHDPRY